MNSLQLGTKMGSWTQGGGGLEPRIPGSFAVWCWYSCEQTNQRTDAETYNLLGVCAVAAPSRDGL